MLNPYAAYDQGYKYVDRDVNEGKRKQEKELLKDVMND